MFLKVRVRLDRREGDVLICRSIGADEADDGGAIDFYPYKGESLHFPPGSVRANIRQFDQFSRIFPDNYALLANTIWTWLAIFRAPAHERLQRHLYATARRLDIAHTLWFGAVHEIATIAKNPKLDHIEQRALAFHALANAELSCVALSRAVEMLHRIPTRFGKVPLADGGHIRIDLPKETRPLREALKRLRNAFEHVGEGAGSPEEEDEILAVVHQHGFFRAAVLQFKDDSVNFASDLFPLIALTRQAILSVAVQITGDERAFPGEITFCDAPPEDHDYIEHVAYFLWENRTGTCWWDAVSNWLQAERALGEQRRVASPASGPMTNETHFIYSLDCKSC